MIKKIITTMTAVGWMATGATSYAAQPLTVAELFTSEGCSSCPPADRLLQSLADNPNILALSFHVNYWDYIGWKDPFALQSSTDRQRHYARALQSSSVFTPQMIVGGRYSVVGSQGGDVKEALVKASGLASVASITIDRAQNSAMIAPIGRIKTPLDIWLVRYQKQATSVVARGENAGSTLNHRNVVRSIEKVGSWDGAEHSISLPVARDATDGVAILLQQPGYGAIVEATNDEAS